MATAELRQEWQIVYGSPAPQRVSPDLLRRAIAYRIQEKAFGGLDAQSLRLLSADGPAVRRKAQSGVTCAPTPGSRLIREWAGRTHQVDVSADGFSYEGRHYKSLSQIARLITGTRWSGPAFFGLRKRQVQRK